MKAYIFAGQGSQFRGMGGQLFREFPEHVDRVDEILGYSIEELCLSDPNEKLGRTEYTQPAIYVVNALSYMAQTHGTGEKPDYCAGHSLGEYNALLAAGAFSFEDGLRMVAKRGELMGNVSGGGMAAVIGLSEEDIRRVLRNGGLSNIDLANFNTPSQLVISGPKQDIDAAQPVFEEMGAMYHVLRVGGAFHSRFMLHARRAFEVFIKQFDFETLRIPVISNHRASPYVNGNIPEGLTEQITAPVRWAASIGYMARQGVIEWKEVAPRPVLTSLLRQILKEETSMQ